MSSKREMLALLLFDVAFVPLSVIYGESVMPRIEFIVPDSAIPPFSLPREGDFSALIGRGEDCDIRIPIASVSSRHAIVERVPGGIELRDIGSTNGLLVSGERVEKVLLSSEKTVMIGEAVLVYSESEEDKVLFNSESKGEEQEKEKDSEQAVASLPEDPWADDVSDIIEEESVPSILIKEQRSNYIPMVLYAIVIFALAVVAGMTYQHYKKTGNLLPLIWMGREPLPVKASESAEKAE